ncbi:EcsC family protein [Halalkalibacterium halodurans]|uniref:EcsC family protein n=1 Tax=Halalkalibacterium halodurans TaxID=86665 RepID=UPI002E1C27EB|nr:EcsC family protein [Halalkalibacterium halodurans]
MTTYEEQIQEELSRWKRKMLKRPSMTGRYAKKVQGKLNELVPNKVHEVVSTSVRNMVQATIIGSDFTAKYRPVLEGSLEERETRIDEVIAKYKKTAAAEGAGTGAGGILLGLADFPLLLGIKMNLLFEVASNYGFDVRDYRERLFLLHVFQLAFSKDEKRRLVFERVEVWGETLDQFPNRKEYLKEVDWKTFQLEYRDYIDLPKMLQLIPGFGAIVGATANYRFLDLLGETAKQCYRMRLLHEHSLQKQ